MNRLYTVALALAMTSGAVLAQSKAHLNSNKVAPTLDQPVNRPATGGDRAIIWSDDFSVASNWSIAHDGPENLDWTIGTTVPTGGFDIAGIASTTAANGFAMVNSDGLGNTSTNYEQSHLTNAAPIDLTGHPNVVLEFQTQYYKWTDEECYVVVQTSNSGWPLLDPSTDISAMPNVFRVWPGMATQDPVINPTVKRINISAVAGDQSTVYVRFYWSGIYGYQWYVDDVDISNQPDIDAAMKNSFLSETGTGEEYGRVPSSQLPTDMNVGGDLINYGVNSLTNPSILMEVRDASNTLMFSATATQPTLAPGDTLHMDQNVALPALPIGLYTGTFTASSDENANDGQPDNNIFLRTFEVTNTTYSLDEVGGHPPGYKILGSLGTASFTGGADGLFAFTYYPVLNDLTVYGIQVLLTANSVPGGDAIVALHDTADVLANNVTTPLAQSADHIITQADIDAGSITVLLSTPYTLPPGGYYASVEMYSNTNANDFRVVDDVTVPQPSLASAIYIPADQVYTNGNALAIRMISDPSIGIAEQEGLKKGITIYPNPSNGLVSINANTSETYMIEVMDMLGATIRVDHFNMRRDMDLSGLAKGVYSVRVSNAKASTVKLITLE